MNATPGTSVGPKVLRAAVAASMLLAAAAHAGNAGHKVVLSGYEDSAGGSSLLAGRYDAVIAELADHGLRFNMDEVAGSTNLCVAYIMTKRWNAAHSACDDAISTAKLDAPDPNLYSYRLHNDQVALAYSNRAVLNWLENRPASAADDLSRARALSPGSQFVSQNLTAFASAPQVAAVITTHHE